MSPQASAQYNNRSDLHWDRASIDGAYVARPLQMDWHGKLQPLLAISPYHLIVAAGRTMYFNVFEGDSTTGPSIRHGAFYTHPNHDHITNDITSISILEDDGFQCHVLVGFHMGSIHEFVLEGAIVTPHYPPFQFLHNESVESLRTDGMTLLSLASNGHAALTNLSTSDSSYLRLEGRSWTSYMSLQSPTPFAAFGSSSSTPLVVYTMSNDGFASEPSAILGMSSKAGPYVQSAVYGISSAPPASPWGSSSQIIASGWYDGRVRCYDLRASLRGPSQSGSPPILYPVMSVYDPLLCEPIYSVSCGGGSASHIAAGSARHSVVSFWDVRFPKLGWSVHAPGNDSSPVYDVILESSRLYGATQSRTFVIDMVSLFLRLCNTCLTTRLSSRGRELQNIHILTSNDGIIVTGWCRKIPLT